MKMITAKRGSRLIKSLQKAGYIIDPFSFSANIRHTIITLSLANMERNGPRKVFFVTREGMNYKVMLYNGWVTILKMSICNGPLCPIYDTWKL